MKHFKILKTIYILAKAFEITSPPHIINLIRTLSLSGVTWSYYRFDLNKFAWLISAYDGETKTTFTLTQNNIDNFPCSRIKNKNKELGVFEKTSNEVL